jgi:leucyl-tRNA synthetase
MADKSKIDFNPGEIEAKWQKEWETAKLFSPDLETSKNPYFNLMMFPYPSAEGLHVGNMYAFTGADVYARFNRMQGKDVFEPIGLDGFGIHSENYALKIGKNPKEQAKVSQARFYKQLRSIGNSFDWTRTLETYDPFYYRWTQWLFIKLFQSGLAYRKKAEVNWCPSCKTVLSDEQVIDGKCERCGSTVEKKDLEQWFFKITDYAERLLDNIEKLDWTEKVKVAQRNWIGKKTGTVIEFPVDKKYRFINLHGFTGSPESDFHPWLKSELEKKGYKVEVPRLPESDKGSVDKQIQYVIDNYTFDKDTVLFGHSLGTVVALKVLERIDRPITKLVLAAGFAQPGFLDHERPFEKEFDWKFDWEKIKKNAGEIVLLRAKNDTAVPRERSDYVQSKIGGKIIDFEAEDGHITGKKEPVVLENMLPNIEVFTVFAETIYGVTYIVVAPENPLVDGLTTREQEKEVSKYIKTSKNKTNDDKIVTDREKTGVFTGSYCINPVNGERVPIWVADYVLAGYGTGAVMGVPGSDHRDFAFAKKYGLPIIRVVGNSKDDNSDIRDEQDVLEEGILVNSAEFSGLKTPKEAREKIKDFLVEKGFGKRENQYHLRDWLISRQRYWGPPIPMIFCSDCEKNGKGEREGMPGWYSVPLDQLSVLLPDVVDWKPMGIRSGSSGQAVKSPLANHPEFYETKCPSCASNALRETDVSDTFLDSAWYFLGYISDIITGDDQTRGNISRGIRVDHEDFTPWDKNVEKKWLPVKKYIGGAEHSVLHLLYARFITMVLSDLKLIDFEEPFTSFFAHGLIIKDGAKMSKSKGNVVVPDEYIEKYGADTLRTYLMFLGPFSDGGDFRDSGIEGMNRFIKRVWKKLKNPEEFELSDEGKRIMNKTIKKVTEDISDFKYNTAIASLMEWYNFLAKHEKVSGEEAVIFIKLVAPFAPFMTEEIWHNMGNKDSIHKSSWPVYDSKYLESDELVIVIQVNGKKRGELKLQKSELDNRENLESQAREMVSKYLESGEKKVIYIPGKILNFVV